jgi:PEP-CTERM motif
MKFNLRAVAFAAAALVAGGAQADFNQVASGDGTLLFVAIDANNNISFTADLGLTISSFTNGASFTTGLAAPVTWNFATDATNSGIAGTNAWSAAYSTFSATQSGGDFTWGVIAGENVSGGTVAARNTLSTGNATQQQMTNVTTAAQVTNALTPLAQFSAAVNNFGNLNAVNTNGAATTTPGDAVAYVNGGGSIFNNFNGINTWSYMLTNGASSTFQRVQQFTNPTVTQFGAINAVDSLAAAPITFTFDIATNTLVLAPAIPEPGTYAMLLAGLAAVGFMARRRKA